MPASPHLHALPVHPHQLEVQEFDSYDLIVDLRSAEAFARDHIPGAVSIPSTSSESDAVIPGSTAGAAVAAAMEPARRLPYAIEAHLAVLATGSALLVYCDHGGALSVDLAVCLAQRGFTADVLPGGWASYRRWVTAAIEVLARALDWRWVRSSPGGASQAVVQCLTARGEQAFSTATLFGRRPLLHGLLADASVVEAPSLESRLVDVLRRFDPAVRVWADEVMALSGAQVLPTPIDEALRHAHRWRVDLPLAARAELLASALRDSGATAATLIDALGAGRSGLLADTLDGIRGRLGKASERDMLAMLLTDVLDPLYASLAAPNGAGRDRTLQLVSGAPTAVDRLAAQLAGAQIRP